MKKVHCSHVTAIMASLALGLIATIITTGVVNAQVLILDNDCRSLGLCPGSNSNCPIGATIFTACFECNNPKTQYECFDKDDWACNGRNSSNNCGPKKTGVCQGSGMPCLANTPSGTCARFVCVGFPI